NKPLTVTKPAKAGDSKIYVANLEQYPSNYSSPIYVASRSLKGEMITPFSTLTVRERNVNEGYIVLNGSIHEDFPVGYNLEKHKSVSPVSFETRAIPGNNEWTTYTISSKVK